MWCGSDAFGVGIHGANAAHGDCRNGLAIPVQQMYMAGFSSSVAHRQDRSRDHSRSHPGIAPALWIRGRDALALPAHERSDRLSWASLQDSVAGSHTKLPGGFTPTITDRRMLAG